MKKTTQNDRALSPVWWCECGQVERVKTDDVMVPMGKDTQFRRDVCKNCQRGGMRLVAKVPDKPTLEQTGHNTWY